MILPPQMLPMSEKLKRHEVTGKNNIEETIDYYINNASWNAQTTEILELYQAVEGYLNPNQYKNIQNPFANTNNDSPQDALIYNAKLTNYNILKGIVNLLMGEFGRRTHEFITISSNPTDEITKQQGLDLVIQGYYKQRTANQLLKLGMKVDGVEPVELPPLEEVVKDYNNTFQEQRLLLGQEALDYIKYNCDLDSKYIDLYWDWVITGRACTYKTVNNDDVVLETVPAHEIFMPLEKHSRFGEDYSYAIRRQVLPVFKVLDFFKGRADKELVEKLEGALREGLPLSFNDIQMTGRNGLIKLPTLYTNNTNLNIINSIANGVELFHVVYKSFKEYYVLTYTDEFGIERTMEVNSDYKLNKALGDIKLELEYESTIMEGYKCLDLYLDCGELAESRADLNNNGVKKLPYNSIMERSSTGEIQSIVKDGLDYQRLVNVMHYQMEKLLNKNKDKVTVIPYGLIPRKKGIDTKTAMYHMDATSVLWIDETAPNAGLASQLIKTLDMGLGNYIKDVVEVMRFIKSEYWDSIGMNAQRYADIGANAGKAVTDQAIIRSAIITYELTRQFDKFIEKDYQGLLDISKLAWINGKKGEYIRSDGSFAFLDINEDGAVWRAEASFGVFVKDSSVMSEAIQALRGQGMNFIQNGASPSLLSKLWATDNITKLDKILEKMESNKQKYDELVAKQEQDANQALQDSVNANDEANRKVEIYKIDKDLEGIKYTADKRSESNSRNEERPANDVERLLANHKVQTDNKALAIQKEQGDKKNQVDLIKAKNSNKVKKS